LILSDTILFTFLSGTKGRASILRHLEQPEIFAPVFVVVVVVVVVVVLFLKSKTLSFLLLFLIVGHC